MRIKMAKQFPPAPTASAVGPCPTVIQIVGRLGTGSLPSTIAPPDHPPFGEQKQTIIIRENMGNDFRELRRFWQYFQGAKEH